MMENDRWLFLALIIFVAVLFLIATIKKYGVEKTYVKKQTISQEQIEEMAKGNPVHHYSSIEK